MVWPAVIGGISALTSGAMSYIGASKANEQNRSMAREQMGFQERMSNTAYQRAVQDMRSAGLNPMLAYTQGGANSPGGAMSTSTNEAGSAAHSAVDAMRTAAEIQNLRKQNLNIQSQTELNKALTSQASATTGKTTSDTIRSWVDTLGKSSKDILPWMLLLLRKGR